MLWYDVTCGKVIDVQAQWLLILGSTVLKTKMEKHNLLVIVTLKGSLRSVVCNPVQLGVFV